MSDISHGYQLAITQPVGKGRARPRACLAWELKARSARCAQRQTYSDLKDGMINKKKIKRNQVEIFEAFTRLLKSHGVDLQKGNTGFIM